MLNYCNSIFCWVAWRGEEVCGGDVGWLFNHQTNEGRRSSLHKSWKNVDCLILNFDGLVGVIGGEGIYEEGDVHKFDYG